MSDGLMLIGDCQKLVAREYEHYKSEIESLLAKLDIAVKALESRPQLNAQEFEQLRVVSAFVHEYDTWQIEARKALMQITESTSKGKTVVNFR